MDVAPLTHTETLLAIGLAALALLTLLGGGGLLLTLWRRVASLAASAGALADDVAHALASLRTLAERLAAAGSALADARQRLDALDGRLDGVLDVDTVRGLIEQARNQDETNAAVQAVHGEVRTVNQAVSTLEGALVAVQAALQGQGERVAKLAGEDQGHFHTYEVRSRSQTDGRARHVLVCTDCDHRVVFLGPLPAAFQAALSGEPAAEGTGA